MRGSAGSLAVTGFSPASPLCEILRRGRSIPTKAPLGLNDYFPRMNAGAPTC
jgi:hypothetical protein